MRLLLVGAFPYPHFQGSQIYFQEQAIALRTAGADVRLLTYGGGPSDADSRTGPESDPEGRRALDGFLHDSIPDWAVPASRRSGPNRGKPVADLALAFALRRVVRSVGRSEAARSRSRARAPSVQHGFDAILAHHVEAALAALVALPRPRPPIVFCAHTLLEHELPHHVDPRGRSAFVDAGARAAGATLDRWIARRADAWIALTPTSARFLAEASPAPGRLVPPPIPDPRADPMPLDPDAIARAHGLVAKRFFLYTGNLDAYQDLALLDAVAAWRADRAIRPGAARAATGSGMSAPWPIVVATHEADFGPTRGVEAAPFVRPLRLTGPREARALVAAAAATLVPRRTPGGFPIKLANSLACGTPVVALQEAEWGLRAGFDSLIGDPARPVESIAAALAAIETDDGLAERLAAGARTTWQARHAPARVAQQIFASIDAIRRES